ncbi:LysM peptidoglycan-binding domain-containing protein [bacterium]|nr:MAG: LysM peptidoglycan-binding domain-containing protein [bacterium]
MNSLARFFTPLILAALLSCGAPAKAEGWPVDPVGRLVAVGLPEKILFCGKEIPLGYEDVRERLEFELLVILGNPVQTSLWLKRMPRYFPDIERALKQEGLPDDLKYVAVAESNLRADALSKAGASGPWQFMKATGSEKGLKQTRCMDERRDWDKATCAATDFLEDLYGTFGDWPLALAAYNAGPGRVMDARREQGESSYFALKLPAETERYVFRIIAAKLVGENPERFGIDMSQAKLYAELDTDEVELSVRKSISPKTVASYAGISYRYLLILNPWMTGGDLPEGRYFITIPAANKELFAKASAPSKQPPPPPAVKPAAPDQAVASAQTGAGTYDVQPGDSLSLIARKHSVKLGDLMSANGLGKTSPLKPGQKLIIPVQN